MNKSKLKFFIMAIIFIIVICFAVGCSSSGDNKIESSLIDESRFCVVSADSLYDTTTIFTVYDKDTKVMYMIVRYASGYKGGITVTIMIDENGNPLLYNAD